MLRPESGLARVEKTRGLGTRRAVSCRFLDDNQMETKPVVPPRLAHVGREFDSPRLHHLKV